MFLFRIWNLTFCNTQKKITGNVTEVAETVDSDDDVVLVEEENENTVSRSTSYNGIG